MLKTETTADGLALTNVFGSKLAESALEQVQGLVGRRGAPCPGGAASWGCGSWAPKPGGWQNISVKALAAPRA